MVKNTHNANLEDNIWIALANVKPRSGFENILDGHSGAFLNIIVSADNIEKLKELAYKVFYEEGFTVIALRDMELLSDRLKKFDIDQDILDLVENLSETYPVQFGAFHTYPEGDES